LGYCSHPILREPPFLTWPCLDFSRFCFPLRPFLSSLRPLRQRSWPRLVAGQDFRRSDILCGFDRSEVEVDVKHIKWDEIPAERLNDKFVRKLAWDGKIMIGLTLVEQGYVVPLHSHDNEQITFVTSGKWRFSIDGKVTDVGPNEMISIPANVPHTAEAVETLVAYDIFTPPREDWIEGKDAYLRQAE